MITDPAPRRAELGNWLEFFAAESHVLKERPDLVWQQSANWPRTSAVARRAAATQAAGRWTTRPWLKLVNPPEKDSGCLMTLTGYAGGPVAVTADGRYIVAGEKFLQAWDATSGREVDTFYESGGWVESLSVTPDGRHVVARLEEHALRVCELATGAELFTLSADEVVKQERGLVGSRPPAGAQRHVLEKYRTGQLDLAVAVAPDGRRVVLGNKLWGDPSMRPLTLAGNPVGVWGWTPDGSRIFSALKDGSIRIWDASSGRELRQLEGKTSLNVAVYDSAAARKQVGGSTTQQGVMEMSRGVRKKILKFRINADGLVLAMEGAHAREGGGVHTLAVSPDGKRLASLTWDNSGLIEGICGALTHRGTTTIKVWEIETGRELVSIKGYLGKIGAAVFIPPGDRLVTSGSVDDTRLLVWDSTTGELLYTLDGHGTAVERIAVSADGRRIVSASEDGTLKVWDAEFDPGAALIVRDGVLPCPKCGILSMPVEDMQIGVGRILSHSSVEPVIGHADDGSPVVMHTRGDLSLMLLSALRRRPERQVVRKHNARVLGINATTDGQRVASLGYDWVRIWDAHDGRQLPMPWLGFKIDARGGGSSFCGLQGRRMASVAQGRLNIWDLDSGRTLHRGRAGVSFDVVFERLLDSVERLVDRAEPARRETFLNRFLTVANTADRQRLLTLEEGSGLKVWDAHTGRKLFRLEWPTEDAMIALTPDGGRLISVINQPENSRARVWEVTGGKPILEFDCYEHWVTALAVTPDGSRLVTAGRDHTLKVWDLATGGEVLTLKGHGAEIGFVVVSPDGRRIVSATADRMLGSFAVETGAPGIVSGSADPSVRVWDAATGVELAVFYCQSSPACITVQDELIAVGDEKGFVYILETKNLEAGPRIVTPRLARDGHYYRCPYCLTRPKIPAAALGTEQRCAVCERPLRLNPFTMVEHGRLSKLSRRGARCRLAEDPPHGLKPNEKRGLAYFALSLAILAWLLASFSLWLLFLAVPLCLLSVKLLVRVFSRDE